MRLAAPAALAARELLDRGEQPAVADDASASGSASKPMIAIVEPLRLAPPPARRAPCRRWRRRSRPAARPCRRGSPRSPTRPRRAAKFAVCSTTILYLSFTGSSTLCSALVAVDRRAGAGLALQVDDAWRRPGTARTISLPWASPPLTLSAPTWARMPVDPSTRRSMVTTGMPASTACLSAGAIALTSSGLMTMPSTPWTIAASTSAVCLGGLVLAVESRSA